MRKMFAIILATGCFGTSFGCHHMAGVCDCDAGPYDHNHAQVIMSQSTTAKTTEPPLLADKLPVAPPVLTAK